MSDFTLRFTGAVSALSPRDRIELLDRTTSRDEAVRAQTAAIIARVCADGDAALRALAREFDGVALEQLEVPREYWRRALDALDPALRRAMERAASNIARAHAAAMPRAVEVETEPGIVIGRRPDPLGRVGVYAPGGRAAYPSSVLMGVVPARMAGVGEVIVCSPPGRDGVPSQVVLAAAELAGVDRVFALGGAGAIAALAYGTATVPRVDRIVGPGNAYVAEAKLQVAGTVAIDSPAGPSELLVIADAIADPRAITREMLAQAEHDLRACVIAVTIGAPLAARVVDALRDAISSQPRRAIIAQALATRGAVLSVASLAEAIAFANDYAPEHLLLAVADSSAALADVRHAGTVFLDQTSSVAFGDYLTGANHVLPTGGLARSYSGLSTLDFVRWTTYQRIEADAAARLAADVSCFADAEGLPAHAAAARGAGDRGLAPRLDAETRGRNRGLARTSTDTTTATAATTATADDADERGSIGMGRELQTAESEECDVGCECEFRASTPTTSDDETCYRAAVAPATPGLALSPPNILPGPSLPTPSLVAIDPRAPRKSAVPLAVDPRSSAFIRGSSCCSSSAALCGRASYRDITLYAPDRSAARIDLSDNTNLWGPPPAAARVLRQSSAAALTRYPALYAVDLKSALADYTGARREEIVTGCGSDDVLDSAIRAFAEPGDHVAYSDPSFAMLPLFAKMNGIEGVAAPLTPDFDIDADAMLATGARIIYLCSPNNPTGTPAERSTIERIIAHASGLVILDEAYAEFADDSFLADALRSGRVLVVRTMSKAFGLAGLRVGYAVGRAELVAEVEKSRGPYKVNAVAERAAVTALRDDLGWVQARVAEVRANRAQLHDALAALGLAPLPSAANFVLVPVPDAMTIARRMRERGIAVRPFAALAGVGDALRITIGPWSLMDETLGALAGALSCA